LDHIGGCHCRRRGSARGPSFRSDPASHRRGVGLIAALTLAGTGITTYICPVSVTVVLMSRTTVPFFFSVIVPAKNASAGLSRLFQSL
jgi:hypothetical protein